MPPPQLSKYFHCGKLGHVAAERPLGINQGPNIYNKNLNLNFTTITWSKQHNTSKPKLIPTSQIKLKIKT